MYRNSTIAIFAVFIFHYGLKAQHQEPGARPATWKGRQQAAPDTNFLLYAFKSGHFSGHFRYFLMATDNQKGIRDFYANAMGGGIRYETARFHGFQLGISGYFVFNLGSSNLAVNDNVGAPASRYEIGLFDITDPENRNDIDRLEELFLKYSRKSLTITMGKQLLNTPFINLQDGRMRPTEVGGLSAEWIKENKWDIQAAWLNQVSPRSTVAWYKPGESIGIYSDGVNPDGSPSDYAGHLQADGIGLASLRAQVNQKWSLQLHELVVPSIFNSLLVQSDYQVPLSDSSVWNLGLQYIRQDALGNGGNADPSKTYFKKNGSSQVFGIRVQRKFRNWTTQLNYTRITSDGRYLMPREWGREPFFTFLPRERNEGLGDLHAWMARADYQWTQARLHFSGALGYYDLPDVKNYRLNKYGLPSYLQYNLELKHEFSGWLQGADLHLLYAHKINKGETYQDDFFVANKVNMGSWNMVLNYHF